MKLYKSRIFINWLTATISDCMSVCLARREREWGLRSRLLQRSRRGNLRAAGGSCRDGCRSGSNRWSTGAGTRIADDTEAFGEHALQENRQERESGREADEERLAPREAHASALSVREFVQSLPALDRDARRRRHAYIQCANTSLTGNDSHRSVVTCDPATITQSLNKETNEIDCTNISDRTWTVQHSVYQQMWPRKDPHGHVNDRRDDIDDPIRNNRSYSQKDHVPKEMVPMRIYLQLWVCNFYTVSK